MGNYFKYQINKIPKILDQTESQNIYLGKIIFLKKIGQSPTLSRKIHNSVNIYRLKN